MAPSEKQDLRQTLLDIRDGLRSGGRVWLKTGTLGEDGTVEREQGPSLRDFINAAIDRHAAAGQEVDDLITKIAKRHFLQDLLTPADPNTPDDRRILKAFFADLRTELTERRMRASGVEIDEQTLLQFEFDMLDAGDDKSESDRLRHALRNVIERHSTLV